MIKRQPSEWGIRCRLRLREPMVDMTGDNGHANMDIDNGDVDACGGGNGGW
jgi:hypothetical protein